MENIKPFTETFSVLLLPQHWHKRKKNLREHQQYSRIKRVREQYIPLRDDDKWYLKEHLKIKSKTLYIIS